MRRPTPTREIRSGYGVSARNQSRSCCRLAVPDLVSRLATWVSTVRGERNSRSEIAALVSPRSTSGARRAPGWSPPPPAGRGGTTAVAPAPPGRRAGAAQQVAADPGQRVLTGLLVRGQVGPQQRHRVAPAVGDGRLEGEAAAGNDATSPPGRAARRRRRRPASAGSVRPARPATMASAYAERTAGGPAQHPRPGGAPRPAPARPGRRSTAATTAHRPKWNSGAVEPCCSQRSRGLVEQPLRGRPGRAATRAARARMAGTRLRLSGGRPRSSPSWANRSSMARPSPRAARARVASTSVPTKANAGSRSTRRAADQRRGRLDRGRRSVGEQQPDRAAGSRPGPPGPAARAATARSRAACIEGDRSSASSSRLPSPNSASTRHRAEPVLTGGLGRGGEGVPRGGRIGQPAGSGPAHSRPRSAAPRTRRGRPPPRRAASSAASATRPAPWAASARTRSATGRRSGRPARVDQLVGPRPLTGLHRGRGPAAGTGRRARRGGRARRTGSPTSRAAAGRPVRISSSICRMATATG